MLCRNFTIKSFSAASWSLAAPKLRTWSGQPDLIKAFATHLTRVLQGKEVGQGKKETVIRRATRLLTALLAGIVFALSHRGLLRGQRAGCRRRRLLSMGVGDNKQKKQRQNTCNVRKCGGNSAYEVA